MGKRGILITIMFLVIPFVLANQNYYQEANADLNLAGGKGYIGYSTNDANIFSGTIEYNKCGIDGTVYSTIATDMDNDSLPDIISPEASALRVYSQNCDLIAEQLLGVNHEAMPVLLNWDEDDKQNIIVMQTNTLDSWEYQYENDTWSLEQSIDHSAFTNSIPHFTCWRGNDLCYAFKGNDVYRYNFTNDSVHEVNAALGGSTIFDLGNIRSGVSVSRTVGNTEPRTVACLSNNGAANKLSCAILNETGQLDINIAAVSTGGNILGISYSSGYIAKMGSITRLFSNVQFDKGGQDLSVTNVFDLAGNNKHQAQPAGQHEQNRTSNIVVGDFDHGGVNDACYLQNESNSILFKCFDSTFVAPTYNINVTDIMNWTPYIVMADFCSSGYSGIATVEGIFCSNSTDFNKTTDSGYKYSATRNGQPMIISSPTSGSPIVVYTDSSIGWILRNTAVADDCGNGVCDMFENEFSCPVDCILTGDEQCLSDSDCIAPFSTCLENLCVETTNTSFCSFDVDCPIDEPICYAGTCISRYMGGVVTTDETDFKESMNNAIGMLTGGNKTLRYIIGMFLLVLIIVGLGKLRLDPYVIGIAAIVSCIGLTMIGFLPLALIILMILAALVILFLSKIFSSSSHQ